MPSIPSPHQLLKAASRRLSLLLPVLVLAACGGGGGGGSGDIGSGDSLVPPAPPVGAVLYADASVLRPLRDRAEWKYRGQHVPGPGLGTTYYTSRVTHAASAGGVTETSAGIFLEGTDSIAVSIVGGSVNVQLTDPLGIGAGQTVVFPELRSPVRVDDQYTQLELRNVSAGDLDGDARDDFVDIAVYSRVIGMEDVTLPELGRTVSALRVDMTQIARVTGSFDNVPSIISAVQSTWYLPGVGVVRRKLTDTSATGAGTITYDEQLYSWDGVTEGLGAVGPSRLRVPVGSPVGAGLFLPSPLSATVIGDKALIATRTLRSADQTSLTIGVLDQRGNPVAVREYPGWLVSPIHEKPRLHAINDNLALLTHPIVSPSTGLYDLRLQRIDSSGAPLSSDVTLPVGAAGDVVPAWDGQVLWLTWRSGQSIYLRPHSTDGTPLAAARTVDTVSTGAVLTLPLMAASNGRVLLTWTRGTFLETEFRYAVVRGVDDPGLTRTLATVPWASSFSGTDSEVTPILGSSVAALAWRGPIMSVRVSGPLPERRARGVILDDQWQPVRSGAGSPDDELLPSAWTTEDVPLAWGALGDRVFAAGLGIGRTYTGLPQAGNFVLGSFMRPGSAALATEGANAQILANAYGSLSGTGVDLFGSPRSVLLWSDRALVIGDTGGTTNASLFWLR